MLFLRISIKKFLILMFIFSVISWGRELKIMNNDRVLIVAPHPDDEILACGGIIQKCVLNNIKVFVMYITDGENNKLSLLSLKELWKKALPNRFISLGEIRKRESINACKILGLKKENLFFLDYPDGGIYKIFLMHWGKEPPYMDDITKSFHLEKKEGITPFALYKGESILSDIEKVLLVINPTKIFFPSPVDQHPDHLATYLFCLVALTQLNKKVNPEKFCYLVHKNKITLLEKYNSFWFKDLVDYFDKNNSYVYCYLNESEREKKRKSISCFFSQMYCKNFLYSFVDNIETFTLDIPPLCLKENFNLAARLITGKKNAREDIWVRKSENKIVIKFLMPFKEKNFKGSIFLFGLKKNRDFSEMPKIRIEIKNSNYQIYDKEQLIFQNEVKINYKKREIYLEIPFEIIGNPDEILFNVEVSHFYSKYNCIWRMIKVNKNF